MSERAGSTGSAFWADADETEALRRYRTLVNAIDDGIYQLDAEGRFVAVNDVIVETTGHARDELVGEHVSLVLDADDVSTIEREIERRLADSADRNEAFELSVRTADGNRVPCELRLNLLVEDGSFRGTTGVIRDITDRKRAERTLSERDRQLERESDLTARILETSPVGILVLDSDGELTRLNDRAAEILGITEDERETYEPGDRPAYDEAGRPIPTDEHPFARALETGEPVYDRTLQVERPDGDRRWLSVSAAPILNDDGEVEHVVTTGEDITPIKERERELENELSDIFGRVTDAFYALDDRWRITYANERAEELIDYTGEGLVSEDFWDVFAWATDSKLGEEYRTAMETQEPTSFEFYYPEPLEAWYEVHAYPSETGLSVYFRDVTERKRRERQLEESERRYRTLVEHFPNGAVALVDENLNYRTVGGSPLDVADVPVHEIEDRPVEEALPSKLADELIPRYEAAFEGESDSFEAESNGRTYQFQVVPVRDDDGDVFAALGMSQNITEHKEQERYLRDAKSQLEAATEAGAVGTWEWRIPEDEFVTGASFARTFGVDPEAAREGVPLDRITASIHEDDRERVEREIERVMESCGEYEEEYRVWDANDELRWVVARGHVECDDGKPIKFPGALTDITERKRAEQALQESEKQLRTLLRILPVGVIVAEEDGRLVEANEAAEEIWGGIAEAETVADYEQYRGWWPDSGDRVAPEEWPLARALRGEELTDPEVIEIEGFDDEHRTVLFHSMPVRDESGDVTRAVVTMIDITDREERQQQLQRQNERLESFASMLAHELRNPVTIGQIYSQQLPAETGSEAVEYVTEAFDRIEDMIDIMLMMTRGREAIGENSPVPIADVARDAWEELDAPKRTVRIDIDGEIRADESYVRHLFRNLFENAVQHGGADVTVEVGELPEGFYVADDGRGIPAKERNSVFEAGYTTAASQGGTGLGLAFVEEMADVYGWTCEVTESDEGGARFEFRNVDFVSTE